MTETEYAVRLEHGVIVERPSRELAERMAEGVISRGGTAVLVTRQVSRTEWAEETGPQCPYDCHDMTEDESVGVPCVCQPHRAGGAYGCPEGCPTHNPGGPDVHPDAIGGPATDDEEPTR